MALTRPRAAQIYDIDYKQATRVVTVSNITLSGGAPSQVDGVNLSLNDRVLVTGQSTASQNGIYYVTVLGSGSNGTWSRSLDTNNTGEILTGTIVMVTEGTVYADTQWKLITDGVINVGVTDQVWVQNYSANSISSGTSNVTVLSNSNVTISSAGVANVLTVSSTGIVVAGNIVPSSNVTYSLGTTTQRFSNLWLSNTTIYLGNVIVGASDTQLTVNGANVVTSTANLDIQTSGNISATGNITGGYFIGNGSQLTGLPATYSNAEVDNHLANFGSNTISTTGNITSGYFIGNGATLSSITGANVTGAVANATYADNAGSATSAVTAGTVTTASQPNITSVGTLTSVSVSGNTQTGNLLTSGLISATGNITGNYIFGNGSQLIGLPESYSNANVAAYLPTYSGNLTAGNISVSGNITGNVLTGGLISATGNATAGNILTGGLISATGNATAGNILTDGLISATGQLTAGNIYTGGLSLTGNTITSSGSTLTLDPNAGGGVDGAVVIAGNLSVQGNVTYIDSNVITTNEKSITLANNVNTGSLADGAGIDVGNNNLAYWRFNNATTSWQSNIGLTPAANATLNLGGTSNYWANLYAVEATVSGNVVGGNILGNGAGLSGVNTFSSLAVTGSNTITANSIATALTFTGDSSIVITANTSTNTINFAYGGSGESIFATGGSMGTVDEAVTSSEDLALVTEAVTVSYDLGTIAVNGVVVNDNIALYTITGDRLANNISISTTGNISGNYILGNGALLTGITTSGSSSNISNGTSNVTVVSSGGNVTVGIGGTSNVATFATTGEYISGEISATGNATAGNILTAGIISATGNITGNYFIGNGSQLTGIASGTTGALNIILQQNFGGF